MNYGVVIAAGKSGKMGSNVDRAFLSLGPKPVLAYSLLAFDACEDIDGVVVVVRKERVDATRRLAQMFGCSKVTKVIAGAALRQASVSAALEELPEDVKYVAVHEASRPCVTPSLISEALDGAKRSGAAATAVPVPGSIMRSERGVTVSEIVDESKLWSVQTPQSFKIDVLRRALEHVSADKKSVIDEATAVQRLGESVRLVMGAADNIKITAVDDLPLAATLLKL
jgi:2-C-methyl-D-erythritol 4-phosphate cytidylyltransferase